MSILSDKQISYNGNLPAGVNDADCGGRINELPSLRRFLCGDVTGRLSTNQFLMHFQVTQSEELIYDLSRLIDATDSEKLKFVQLYLDEMEAAYQRTNR